MRRSHRVLAALIALVSLLFMQLAVAASACPMQTQEKPMAMAMADCHMERMSPSLCQAHAEAGKQSLDKAPTPSVQPFVPAAVLVEVAGLDLLTPPSRGIFASSVPSSGASPPIAILHCCFRI
jgi:hypothetical protein